MDISGFMPERKKKGERKVKISGTIKPEQEKWIKNKIKEGKFYNISHILQEGIRLLQVQDDNGK
jgi:Arc/MetJ-type ribon-helix-helix transcriptional regulator